MSLTTKDILEKTFKRSFKGYDEDEVDKFLDQIIDEIKALRSENDSLKKEVNTVRDLEDNIKGTEDTIMNTLVSAQKSSERILREAARKAELLIDNAQTTSKQRIEQTSKNLADMERKLAAIKLSAQNYAASFSEMLNAQSASFEKTYQSYFGDMDAYSSSGINFDALERIDHEISGDINEIVKGNDNAADLDATGSADKPAKAEEFIFGQVQPPDEKPIAVEWNLPKSNDTQIFEAIGQVMSKPAEETPDLQEPVKEDISSQKSAQDVHKPVDGMPLNEINKVLTDIEEAGDDVSIDLKGTKGKRDAKGTDKTKYDDYSWLYGDDKKKEESDFELSFKDPKEGKELKSLIDEVIE